MPVEPGPVESAAGGRPDRHDAAAGRVDGEAIVRVDELGMVDPATGQWHLRNDAGGMTSFYFGNPGDYPILGDWDCDGVDTPGMYRQSDGYVYLRNSNTKGVADVRFFFGNPGDIPLAGDFNGNGCSTVSIYRPATSQVFIINKLGGNEGGLGFLWLEDRYRCPVALRFIACSAARCEDAGGVFTDVRFLQAHIWRMGFATVLG